MFVEKFLKRKKQEKCCSSFHLQTETIKVHRKQRCMVHFDGKNTEMFQIYNWQGKTRRTKQCNLWVKPFYSLEPFQIIMLPSRIRNWGFSLPFHIWIQQSNVIRWPVFPAFLSMCAVMWTEGLSMNGVCITIQEDKFSKSLPQGRTSWLKKAMNWSNWASGLLWSTTSRIKACVVAERAVPVGGSFHTDPMALNHVDRTKNNMQVSTEWNSIHTLENYDPSIWHASCHHFASNSIERGNPFGIDTMVPLLNWLVRKHQFINETQHLQVF